MVDKIFISHCEKLKNRKEYIDSVLSDEPFFKDRTEIIVFDEEMDKKSLANNSYKEQPEKYRGKLGNAEIYITEQMFYIYEQILKQNLNNCLILEDDFVLNDNFHKYKDTIFDSLPDDYDCIFYSSCCNFNVPSDFEGMYWENHQSRCTCAYLVSNEFCRKILVDKTYCSPIDWHLNFSREPLNLKFYWSKPILFEQGSLFKYKSNIKT